MSIIKFHIRKDEEIREVQEKFSMIYPYLRLNFFKNNTNSKKINGESVLFCPDVKMEEMNPNFCQSEFEIDDETTITELENQFHDQFGMSVQIMRKSGNLWLETSMSDHWTLKQQNDHGEAISPQQEAPVYFRQVPYGC